MQQISFSQNIKGDNMLRFLARNKRIFEFFSTRFYTEIYNYIIKQKTRIFSVCLSVNISHFPMFLENSYCCRKSYYCNRFQQL